MCGIVGLWQRSEERLETTTQAMRDSIPYRGPDDAGIWLDKDAGLGLGHRRLSILDLSPEGHQPMVSRNQRYTIVYNGEIYNYTNLIDELKQRGHSFRGHSDTEVILAALSEWSIEQCLSRFNGMFAFALWDRETRQLTLARDRIGIKPLFFGWFQNSFAFASELKPFEQCPGFRREIDQRAIASLLRHNYIPAPHCIYKHVHKLLPGCYLRLSWEHFDKERACFSPFPDEEGMHTPVRYWSARQVFERGLAEPLAMNETEILDALEETLSTSIQRRMLADVPLGAFLSGGIDSSTVVSLMQAQSSKPVKTFSIGFAIDNYNEATFAKEVAQHLQTDHTELYLTPEETMAILPKLPEMYDEPFADSSQIPTYLVSRLAREQVTVSLSGDGGDELFCGYTRYFRTAQFWSYLEKMPALMRQSIRRSVQTLDPAAWDIVLGTARPFLPERMHRYLQGEKLHRVANLLGKRSDLDFYQDQISHTIEPAELLLSAFEPKTHVNDPSFHLGDGDIYPRMMHLDSISYLPDDILTKVDRASMAVSLEARVPLLDHNVIDFAARIPMKYKVRDGVGKWLLRQVLYRHVPQTLIDRPKMGFGIPIHAWLRGPLRDWAEALLDERALREEGIFRPHPIRRYWDDHLHGDQNHSSLLWNVLMFRAWREHRSPLPT